MATGYTFAIEKEMSCAKTTLSVSSIKARKVCKKLNGTEFLKAKKFLENLKSEKISIDGKYYTKATTEILNFLRTVEANAIVQNRDLEAMKLFVSVSKGPRLYRNRRRRSFGLRMKVTNLQAVLKPFEKKVKKKVEKKAKEEKPKEKPKEEKKEEPKVEKKEEKVN